jgi:hypothetical protein
MKTTTVLFILIIISALAPKLSAAPAKMAEIQTEVIRTELRITAHEAGIFARAKTIEPSEGDIVLFGSSPEDVTPMEKIPAAIGTKFGIRFSLGGKSRDQGKIQMLYLTPGVIDDKGARYDKYEVLHVLDRSLSNHVMAFEIIEPYEQVPGSWTFMIFEEDRLLLTETFELIAP